MCNKCHFSIHNKFIIKELQDEINKPNFSEWNNTSIDNVLLSVQGFDGKYAQLLANELIEMYYKWYSKLTTRVLKYIYYEKYTIIQMPTVKELREKIDESIKFNESNKVLCDDTKL